MVAIRSESKLLRCCHSGWFLVVRELLHNCDSDCIVTFVFFFLVNCHEVSRCLLTGTIQKSHNARVLLLLLLVAEWSLVCCYVFYN